MKYLKLSIVCFLAIGLSQCKTGKPDNFDYGSVKENTYSNNFFEMSMDVPEGWAMQSEEAMQQMAEMGSELASGDDIVMKAQIKVSAINTANLLSVFQHEVGAPLEGVNANFTLIAENLTLAPGVKKGSDYLMHTKKFMLQSAANYTFVEETGSESFGGQSFDYMDATLITQGISVQQRFYSTIINGFSFNAILSYGDDNQKAMLVDIIKSMNFK